MLNEIVQEIKKVITAGFPCVNKMADQVRIFAVIGVPTIIIFKDGRLACKGRAARIRISNNKLLGELLET